MKVTSLPHFMWTEHACLLGKNFKTQGSTSWIPALGRLRQKSLQPGLHNSEGTVSKRKQTNHNDDDEEEKEEEEEEEDMNNYIALALGPCEAKITPDQMEERFMTESFPFSLHHIFS